MSARMTQYAVGMFFALPGLALAAGCATMNVNSFAERGVDLLVHYHASVSQEIDVRNLDTTSPYCSENDCRPFIYDKGTLFVDLAEGRGDKLIWRGWAEGSIDGVVDNQAWMESRIDEAIAKILTRLPRRL